MCRAVKKNEKELDSDIISYWISTATMVIWNSSVRSKNVRKCSTTRTWIVFTNIQWMIAVQLKKFVVKDGDDFVLEKCVKRKWKFQVRKVEICRNVVSEARPTITVKSSFHKATMQPVTTVYATNILIIPHPSKKIKIVRRWIVACNYAIWPNSKGDAFQFISETPNAVQSGFGVVSSVNLIQRTFFVQRI